MNSIHQQTFQDSKNWPWFKFWLRDQSQQIIPSEIREHRHSDFLSFGFNFVSPLSIINYLWFFSSDRSSLPYLILVISFTQAFCAVEIIYTQNTLFVTKLNSRQNNINSWNALGKNGSNQLYQWDVAVLEYSSQFGCGEGLAISGTTCCFTLKR